MLIDDRQSSSNGDSNAYGGVFGGGCEYSTSSSGCGNGRPKIRPSYKTIYQDVNGRCVAVQVQEEDRASVQCNCVATDTCSPGEIEIDQPFGPAVAVNVGGGNGISVNIDRARARRRKRTLGAFLDSVLGGHFQRTATNQQVYVPGILDMIPGIDVRVGNRHGLFHDRGVGVRVGGGAPGGIHVNVGGSRFRPFGVHGSRVDSGSCPTCGGLPSTSGQQPVARPIRRRVVTPSQRCPAGQVQHLIHYLLT